MNRRVLLSCALPALAFAARPRLPDVMLDETKAKLIPEPFGDLSVQFGDGVLWRAPRAHTLGPDHIDDSDGLSASVTAAPEP